MTDQEFQMPEMPDFPLTPPPVPEPPQPSAVQPPVSPMPPQQPFLKAPQIPQQPEYPHPPVSQIPAAPIPRQAHTQNPAYPHSVQPQIPEIPQIRPIQPQLPEIPPVTPIPTNPFSQQVPEPAHTVPPRNVPPVPRTYDEFAEDTKRILSLPPITTAEAESCRHRCENRWYRRLILLNVFLIMMTIALVLTSLDDYRKQVSDMTAEMLADIYADSESEDSSRDSGSKDYEDYAAELPLGFKMLSYGIALMTIGYIALYYMNAQVRARSIRVTEHSFPEIHALIRSYCSRLGIPIPDAYIVNESGVLNAFSSFLYHRQYLQINSEIVEVAYREHKDINALAFVIAHEIAHVYYGHATLHYNVWIWFSQQLPLFSQIASRTREYSCDRLAQRLSNFDGVGAMLILIADRHLYHMVDVQDYLNGAARENDFFLWLVNLFSDHPVMTKRIRALAEWNGSGELY